MHFIPQKSEAQTLANFLKLYAGVLGRFKDRYVKMIGSEFVIDGLVHINDICPLDKGDFWDEKIKQKRAYKNV